MLLLLTLVAAVAGQLVQSFLVILSFSFCFSYPFLSLAVQVAPGNIYPRQECSASSTCLRDFYNCRISNCTRPVCDFDPNNCTAVCVQQNAPEGTSCSDLRNVTNYDYCFNGVCLGTAAPSQLVQFSLTSAAPSSILSSYDYPVNLQAFLVETLGLAFTSSPSIRTCLDFTQRLASSASSTNQQIIRTCNVAVCPSTFFSGTCTPSPYIIVEFVQGPGAMDATMLATQAALFANASTSSSRIQSEFYIRQGILIDSIDFFPGEFIPWINGYYLGISIGVACGLFLLTILGCVAFYWVKSSREVYGAVMGQTDSTASVQSGSSMGSNSMSESHASGVSMTDPE